MNENAFFFVKKKLVSVCIMLLAATLIRKTKTNPKRYQKAEGFLKLLPHKFTKMKS